LLANEERSESNASPSKFRSRTERSDSNDEMEMECNKDGAKILNIIIKHV